jgi:hypothetical protein
MSYIYAAQICKRNYEIISIKRSGSGQSSSLPDFNIEHDGYQVISIQSISEEEEGGGEEEEEGSTEVTE